MGVLLFFSLVSKIVWVHCIYSLQYSSENLSVSFKRVS